MPTSLSHPSSPRCSSAISRIIVVEFVFFKFYHRTKCLQGLNLFPTALET